MTTDQTRDSDTRGGATATHTEDALFSRNQSSDYSTQWEDIQNRFVDEPRESVRQADELVSEAIEAITQTFRTERQRLESAWANEEGDSSTEDLRIAFQRYRGFFQRLLSS